MPEAQTWAARVKRTLFGNPRDLHDTRIFHHISLIPFLAWVGLGADGLSSSAYGPEEAFRNLGAHTYLAVALAAVMGLTVFIISAAYRGIIQEFPHGGGGYVVATKLLGRAAGVTSGSALLVDYILTITVSIAAAGDAIFSFLPPSLLAMKMPLEILFILALTTLNLRGAKESAIALAPVFLLFVVTHLALIAGGVLGRVPELPATARAVSSGFHGGLATLGAGGMLLLFVHAYSLGGGTYTGIEAVSNGLPIMREPRVQTAKRTMVYMATSLALTAVGAAALLPALAHHARRREDHERRAGRAADRPPSAGARAGGGHHAVRGGPAGRGGAGRLHRRAARAGQHGRRFLGAAPVRCAVRSPDHPQRHHADGRHLAAGAAVHQGGRRAAGGHVQHQRVPHVLAVDVRHAPFDLAQPPPVARAGCASWPCSGWVSRCAPPS